MPPDFEGQDLLYNLAYECESHFHQLLEVCRTINLGVTTIELCTELQQRFAIWTAYLGVFARKSQCLDTRLRNLPDLQDLVARLLDILSRSLQHCMNEMTCQREETWIPVNDNRHAPGATQTQKAALETVDDIVARLMRLGTTIRQSSNKKIDRRAEKFTASQNMDSFACLCANAVRALYPGASQSLKDYLSNSMIRRYTRMQLSSSRREILGVRRANLPTIEEMPSGETTTDKHSSLPARPAIVPAVPHLQTTFNVAPSVSDFSSVDVQRIRGNLRLHDDAATKLFKTSSIQVKQGNYPQIPTTEKGSNIIPCQWCGEPLNKKQLTETDWRRHIDRDIKPYICLSEECSGMHSAYPTFDEWCRHMELHSWRWHQRVYLATTWECAFCGVGHTTYNSPETLYSHLTESHSNGFTLDQLHVISRQSKIEQRRTWDDCLLCGLSIREQKGKDGPIISKRQKEQQRQKTFKSSRKNLEMISPEHHSSDLDVSDTSDDSDDADSHQQRRQRKDPSNEIARHIATHLQLLMLLTLRFADLQSNNDELDDDIKSNSADIDEEHDTASDDTRYLGNLTEKDIDDEISEEIPVNRLGDTGKVGSIISSNFKLALEENDHLRAVNGNDLHKIIDWLPDVTPSVEANKDDDPITKNDRISTQNVQENETINLSRDVKLAQDDDFLGNDRNVSKSSWLTRKRHIGQPLLNPKEMMAYKAATHPAKLFEAVEAGDVATIKRLLEDGARLEAIDASGRKPLWRAVKIGEPSVMKLLLDYGANPEAEDVHGESALHLALEQRNESLVRYLFAFTNGADPHF